MQDYPEAVRQVLARNRVFVAQEGTVPRRAQGRPARHLAVVSCMDARLTRLLPDALGLADGDATLIKVAGAAVVDPYGELMRSLLVAVAELGVTDVMVVGHTDCGTRGMEAARMLDALEAAGVPRERIRRAVEQDGRAAELLEGFSCLEDEVARCVRTIREHPLMPASVRVWGFTIDVATGELAPVGR